MTMLTVTLKTVTPIWTGGVDPKTCERIHGTGIIGSLRWWYEVVVRGLGGSACDPSEHTCLYDTKKPNDGLCDVCRIFGATGWRGGAEFCGSNRRTTESEARTSNLVHGRANGEVHALRGSSDRRPQGI